MIMYDVYRVREDFPVLKEVTYLDSAATSQKPLQVVAAMDVAHTGSPG
jgi:cysteine desulfurase/selenocysteine lyase